MRLPRDYYVRIDTNDYYVDPNAIGRMVTVSADLTTVRVRQDGRLVAEHDRVWSRGNTITQPQHVNIAASLRADYRQPPSPPPSDGLTRDLTGYDRAFGLTGQVS